jgi:hypothetical protein
VASGESNAITLVVPCNKSGEQEKGKAENRGQEEYLTRKDGAPRTVDKQHFPILGARPRILLRVTKSFILHILIARLHSSLARFRLSATGGLAIRQNVVRGAQTTGHWGA